MASDADNDPPVINDADRSTEGGPPGWIAFVIVAVLFLVGAAAVGAIAVLTG